MKSAIAEAWSTAFYAGFVPKAPGTAGALVGVAFAFLLTKFAYFTGWHLAVLSLAMLLPSVWAANVVIADTKLKDPQIVVMDEVLGQWMAFGGVGWAEIRPSTFVLAFGLFRLFDIVKPFPVKGFEQLPGGWGVMLDDLMAGIYAALSIWALRELAGLPV